jgi:hypothetical protein
VTCRLMLLLAVAALGLPGCASTDSSAPIGRSLGWQVPLGNGTVTSYAEFEG